jgi:hypothetical protein
MSLSLIRALIVKINSSLNLNNQSGGAGKTDLKIGLDLIEKYDILNKVKKSQYIYLDQTGVKNVKQIYSNKYDKQKLYDLIFEDETIESLKSGNIQSSDLDIVWDHGNNKSEINHTLTAGLTGIHIYITTNGTIVGIIERT